MSSIKKVIALVIIIIFSGCMSSEVEKKGIVAWNYKSIANQIKQTKRIPVSIKINQFKSQPTYVDRGLPGGILRIVPLLSPLSPPFKFKNCYPTGTGSEIGLKVNETEQILSKELEKTNLFKNISIGNNGGDFHIKCDLDFDFEIYRHFSGLGIIYLFGIIPPFITPAEKLSYECNANFYIFSTLENRVVFSKKYHAEYKYQNFPYYSPTKIWQIYGDIIYPKILKSFIQDIAYLPKSTWVNKTKDSHLIKAENLIKMYEKGLLPKNISE